MLIRDERGRIGIVTSHTDAGVFAAPLGTPYKIDDKELVTGVDNAVLLTPTHWLRQPDGSYTGMWFDSRLGDFVTAQEITEQSFAASTMGRKGGKSKSERKTAAARENGRRGGRAPKYTFDDRYTAHLGVTGDRTCIVPDQVAADQKAYDGKTFPAIIVRGYNSGKRIRVRLNGDDYDLHGSGTGDMVVRPV